MQKGKTNLTRYFMKEVTNEMCVTMLKTLFVILFLSIFEG